MLMRTLCNNIGSNKQKKYEERKKKKGRPNLIILDAHFFIRPFDRSFVRRDVKRDFGCAATKRSAPNLGTAVVRAVAIRGAQRVVHQDWVVVVSSLPTTAPCN